MISKLRISWPTLACAALALASPALPAQAPSRADPARSERLAARRSQGMRGVFDAPQLELRETGGRTVPIAANAIAARERWQIHAVRMVLGGDVSVGAPFNVRFPARMLLLVRTGDPTRAHCLLPNPEPRDENGRVFPDVCLIDRDGDGRYEIARFQAEDPADPPRDMPIVPVPLRQLPPAHQAGLISIAAEQRLRIARLGRDSVTIATESRLMPTDSNADSPWSSRPRSEVVLRLADGGTAQVAGLQLTIHRDAADTWTMATSGDFAPWLVLRDGNAVIDTGAATMVAQ